MRHSLWLGDSRFIVTPDGARHPASISQLRKGVIRQTFVLCTASCRSEQNIGR
ncbi:hypothetical protein KCP70_07640 [Salmonella enterica subsp. enterica]|nr:hypothetical protein KCP70_07640 [Salmonella enterica subsp. enterica]